MNLGLFLKLHKIQKFMHLKMVVISWMIRSMEDVISYIKGKLPEFVILEKVFY